MNAMLATPSPHQGWPELDVSALNIGNPKVPTPSLVDSNENPWLRYSP
jgi:hypothetical protein